MSTDLFWSLDTHSREEYDDSHTCAPIAASLATGVDYSIVRALYNHYGRKNHKGANIYITQDVLAHLGFLMLELENEYYHLCGAQCFESYESKTVRSIEKELPKDGTYLVTIDAHIMCFKDGTIHDWTKGRMFRVQTVYKVIDCNPRNAPKK